MRKIIFSLFVVLSMCFATQASAFGFDWGVTGGMNLTKMNLKGDMKQVFKSENRAGWFIGAKANLSLALGFGLDGALVYSQQKYNVTGAEHGLYSMSETARSFEVPINVKYSIGLGSLAAVYLATGPQFGFNIGDKTWYNGAFERENMTTSWNVGVGAKLLGHLDLGVSYNFGIGKVGEAVAKEVYGVEWKNDDSKANTFQVQLTYYF